MPDPGRQPGSSKWELCSWSLKITFPFLYNMPDPSRQPRSSKWEQCSRLVEFVSQFLFNMPDPGRQPGSSRWDLLSRSLVIVFPILKVISRIHSNTNHFLASGNRSWFPYNYTDQGRQTRSQKKYMRTVFPVSGNCSWFPYNNLGSGWATWFQKKCTAPLASGNPFRISYDNPRFT